MGGDGYWIVVVVKDEDISRFWQAVSEGWIEQLDFESPPTWAPATLLRTGPDGTVTANLDAGDYLFCTPRRTGFGDCTYEDVTAGQHRILTQSFHAAYHFLAELTEQNSAALVKAMAGCGTSQDLDPAGCASREEYVRALRHYQDTGDWPEDW